NPAGCESAPGFPPVLAVFRGGAAASSLQYRRCVPQTVQLTGACADNPPLRVVHLGPTGEERAITTDACIQMDPEGASSAWFPSDAASAGQPVWDAKPSRPALLETLLHADPHTRYTYEAIAAAFPPQHAANWLEEQTARWKQLRDYF